MILPESKAEALAALRAILVEQQFGEAGDAVLIERLSGPEVSVLAFCDGESAHHAGGAGPQTCDGRRPRAEYGRHGAFAPSPLATPALIEQVEREVLLPAVRAGCARRRMWACSMPG